MAATKPNAILVPRPFPGMPDGDPGPKLKAMFADLIGATTIYRRPQGHQYFITGNPNDTLLFPRAHPRDSEPRYEWYVGAKRGNSWLPVSKAESWQDRQGEVKLGYLVDGAAETASLDTTIATPQAPQEQLDSLDEMLDKGLITQEQHDEMAEEVAPRITKPAGVTATKEGLVLPTSAGQGPVAMEPKGSPNA